MMIYKRNIIFLFLVYLYGCSSMNIPSSPNIALLTQKNEKQIEVSLSTNSICLSGAYAVSNKYSLLFNTDISLRNFSKIYDFGGLFNSHSSETSLFMLNEGQFNHRDVLGGVGRYQKSNNDIISEFYTGLGYGNAVQYKLYDITKPSEEYNNKYYLFFIQGNIGKRNNKTTYGTCIVLPILRPRELFL